MQWPPRRDTTDVRTVPVSIPAGGAACDVGGRRLLGLILTVAGQAAPSAIAMFDGKDGGGQPLGALTADALGNAVLIIGLPGLPLATDLFLSAAAPITGALIIGADT